MRKSNAASRRRERMRKSEAREYLVMTDEERQAFLDQLDKAEAALKMLDPLKILDHTLGRNLKPCK